MFTRRMPKIAEDVRECQANEVVKVKMSFGVDPPQRHGFTAVTVEDAARCFIVDMNDLGFGNIGNFIVMFLRPLCPCQIFESGQRFIVLILFP